METLSNELIVRFVCRTRSVDEQSPELYSPDRQKASPERVTETTSASLLLTDATCEGTSES